MREPYILFRRPDGAEKGKMFYVEFWDPSAPPRGRYVGRRSVGSLVPDIELQEEPEPCKKAGARVIVEEWRKTHTPASGAALLPYLESFWLRGGAYSKRIALESSDKRELSDEYLYNNDKCIRNQFRPWLEEKGLVSIGISRVTPKLLNDFKAELAARGRAASTINNTMKALLVPINDFWAQAGAPERSPARLVNYAAGDTIEREILSMAEAVKVLTLPSLAERDRLVLRLAAFSGMRVSELCEVRPEYLGLESFATPEGTVEYYTLSVFEQARKGAVGEVVLPFDLGHDLLAFAEASPWKEGWIFDGKTRGTSMQKKTAEQISNKAVCEALGIPDEVRKARGLTFHAWRHWYVSYIAPEALRQKLARHKTKAMTEHYTHLTPEDRQESAQAAQGIMGNLQAKQG